MPIDGESAGLSLEATLQNQILTYRKEIIHHSAPTKQSETAPLEAGCVTLRKTALSMNNRMFFPRSPPHMGNTVHRAAVNSNPEIIDERRNLSIILSVAIDSEMVSAFVARVANLRRSITAAPKPPDSEAAPNEESVYTEKSTSARSPDAILCGNAVDITSRRENIRSSLLEIQWIYGPHIISYTKFATSIVQIYYIFLFLQTLVPPPCSPVNYARSISARERIDTIFVMRPHERSLSAY